MFCTHLHCHSQLIHHLAIFSACQKEGIVPKGKEVSDYLRKRIIELHGEGMSYRKISAEINVSFGTVTSIIRKFKQHGNTINLARSRAPRKINARSNRILLRKVKNNPIITREELGNDLEAAGTSVSSRTISRELHRSNIKCFQPRKTPILNKLANASIIKLSKNFQDIKIRKFGFYPNSLRPFLWILCVVDDSKYACRRNFLYAPGDLARNQLF